MNTKEKTDQLYKILEEMLKKNLLSENYSVQFIFRNKKFKIALHYKNNHSENNHIIINIPNKHQSYRFLKNYIFENINTKEKYLDLIIELQKNIIKLL